MTAPPRTPARAGKASAGGPGSGEPAPREERVLAGRALRREVPRSAHAELPDGPPGRDPLAVLGAQDATRIPELLPLRYGRMATSPYTFYRGAAAVMAGDLAGTPSTGLRTQLSGDAHLSNFGLFASPERHLVFDLNDFDETIPGPWEWDVKRLAASVEIAAREKGYSENRRRELVESAVESYRLCMRDLANRNSLDVWYAHMSSDELTTMFAEGLRRRSRRNMNRGFNKARTRDNMGAMRRFVDTEGGSPSLVADPPLIVPAADLTPEGTDRGHLVTWIQDLLAQYRRTLEPDRGVLFDRFRLIDIARKAVGVGSVGMQCWMLLLLGDDDGDPLFLQAKEVGPSVLATHLRSDGFDNEGQRVVLGQRLLQTVGDIFLGWIRVEGLDGRTRDFHLRQLRDWKASAEVSTMRRDSMEAYVRLCGWTLARAHARSGDRIAIASYLGGGPAFDVAVRRFAGAYADRNDADHRRLTDAIASGGIRAADG